MARETHKRMTKADKIAQHMEHLVEIFPALRDEYRQATYKKLHRLEAEAHSFAEKCCNVEVSEAKQEAKDKSLLRRLDAILGFKKLGVPVFINSDPRGYALKIDDSYVKAHDLPIHRDWGGYGIIAPTF